MKPTLGLTGLTMNAMALIAPGAFLWLTFSQQSLYGAPMAGSAMWFGIVVALALCFATAISYAELSKLYPGAGSSYFFAEQAFLSKTHAYKFARLAKYIIGWSSHLYYWIYPGVMVGYTAILVGWMFGQLWPETFNAAVPSPLLMIGVCIFFSFFVSYIAYRGVTGATSVNIAINVIQISALLIFSVIAIGYRLSHGEGSQGFTLDPDGKPINVVLAKGDDGNRFKDANGNWVAEQVDGKDKPFILEFKDGAVTREPVDKDNPDGEKQDTRNFHANAASVVKPHNFSFIIVQACIAILILVGFESVTAMGEEARNAKRDIPRAVILSLLIQGVVCYLIGYFAANFFLNPGYTMPTAGAASAPLGDMAYIAGTSLLGSVTAGWWFMMVLGFTVLLALIGTTLSCINTGARVTYAMGRDDEVPSHFGLLHGKNLTPHRAIWTLAVVSALLGIVCIYFYFCGGAAQTDETIGALPKNTWYSFGLFTHAVAEKIPQGILVVALASNFGTFMLYMLTNVIAIVAFREHHTFNTFKHTVVPVFGLVANVLCMAFYLVGPFFVTGMSWKEPYAALVIAAVWGLWGYAYFVKASKKKGKDILVGVKDPVPATTEAVAS
jgi:amino acid transporter